jgi:hypothetical protein
MSRNRNIENLIHIPTEIIYLYDFIKYVEHKWKNIFFESLVPFGILFNNKIKNISELARFCIINSKYTKCLPGLQASLMDVLNKYKIYLSKEDLENLEIITGYFVFCKTKLKEGENIYKKKFVLGEVLEIGNDNYESYVNEMISLELNSLDLDKKSSFLNSWFHLT